MYRLFFGRNIGPTNEVEVSDVDIQNWLRRTVSHIFEGFTYTPGTVGYWNGKAERGFTLDIVTDDAAGIALVASDYCERFAQDAVLSTLVSAEIQILTAHKRAA